MFSHVLLPPQHLTISSLHRSHFHPCTAHPRQCWEERWQAVLLLPGEVLWDGPDSRDPVPYRTHLPGVYTMRSMFIWRRKHNEKKTVHMKNGLDSSETSHPACSNVYRHRTSIWSTVTCWNPHVSLTFPSTMHPSVCETDLWPLTPWASDLFSLVVLKHSVYIAANDSPPLKKLNELTYENK